MHRWHVEQGAEFEDVGQWKRPWYFPQNRRDYAGVRLTEKAWRCAILWEF